MAARRAGRSAAATVAAMVQGRIRASTNAGRGRASSNADAPAMECHNHPPVAMPKGTPITTPTSANVTVWAVMIDRICRLGAGGLLAEKRPSKAKPDEPKGKVGRHHNEPRSGHAVNQIVIELPDEDPNRLSARVGAEQ